MSNFWVLCGRLQSAKFPSYYFFCFKCSYKGLGLLFLILDWQTPVIYWVQCLKSSMVFLFITLPQSLSFLVHNKGGVLKGFKGDRCRLVRFIWIIMLLWLWLIQTLISKVVSDLREECNFFPLMKPFLKVCELCHVVFSVAHFSSFQIHTSIKDISNEPCSQLAEWLYCQMKNKCPIWVKSCGLPGC